MVIAREILGCAELSVADPRVLYAVKDTGWPPSR